MAQHGVVVVLVVQLQDLDKVVESTLVLGLLAGLVHGEDIGLGEHLLALLLLAANLLDGLEGGVQVAGAEQVAGIVGVDLAVTLEVIDIEGEIDGWKRKREVNGRLILAAEVREGSHRHAH